MVNTYSCCLCNCTLTDYNFHVTLSSGKKICEFCLFAEMHKLEEKKKEAA